MRTATSRALRVLAALALCLADGISAWLAPAVMPHLRFTRARPAAARPACAPRMTGRAGSEDDDAVDAVAPRRQSGAKVSPLIASLVEDEPRPAVRQPLSPADMAQLSADADEATAPERLSEQRRNFILAVASPVVGAAAFASSRSNIWDPSRAPTDPLAILQSMERKSPSIQAALQTNRPTLVDFYGRNCPNCRAMAPHMSKLEAQFHDRVNFVVLDAEKPEYSSIVNLFKVCVCV